MNARKLLIATAIALLPSALFAGDSCSCAAPVRHSVVRPCTADLWEGYQQHPDCGGCGTCRRCCDPCCTPLICVVPNTLRKIGRTLDCLLPCGPRSGHGCGLSCIGAGSGCSPGYCGRPGILSPNKCCDYGGGGGIYNGEVIGHPVPPQPALVPPEPPKETRRAADSSRYARSQSNSNGSKAIGSGVSRADHAVPSDQKPASVLKRTSYEDEITDETPAAIHWPRNMNSPLNPLR